MLRRGKPPVRRRPLPSNRPCLFCQEKTLPDYKNPEVLRRFVSERGRIMAAGKTGICPKHQRKMTQAVKRARHLGLLPFIARV